MTEIKLLSQETIDKIAAGEVVERPASVVKELVENAIDAKASVIAVEIRDGGTSLIRISDNGEGIARDEIALAFLRHSTSKIREIDDLYKITSLGFRGEALSSIAAVSQVELFTKRKEDLLGYRYSIEGSIEKGLEEVGVPDGTTFMIHHLFYNTPARKKFLKSKGTEGKYVYQVMEKFILSHPEISFKFVTNGETKLQSYGTNLLQDSIYQIYGKEISKNLIPFQMELDYCKCTGFLGKPYISRGNRNYENYFVNGRYVKNQIIQKAVEEAYKPFLMQHQYPFFVFLIEMDTRKIDVNVHPTKMELRISNHEEFYKDLKHAVELGLSHKEHIKEVSLEKTDSIEEQAPPKILNETIEPYFPEEAEVIKEKATQVLREEIKDITPYAPVYKEEKVFQKPVETYVQETLFHHQENAKLKMIGQLFDTYWLLEFQDKFYMMDQHAAHEKVLYEKNMKRLKEQPIMTQEISPPIVIPLNSMELEVLSKYKKEFEALGFHLEAFGGKEILLQGIPSNLFGVDAKKLFMEMLDDFLQEKKKDNPQIILERLAQASCKAAVKGNWTLTMEEAQALYEQLMELENPYNCPHGRPTIISMTKYEIEKKFKRIL